MSVKFKFESPTTSFESLKLGSWFLTAGPHALLGLKVSAKEVYWADERRIQPVDALDQGVIPRMVSFKKKTVPFGSLGTGDSFYCEGKSCLKLEGCRVYNIDNECFSVIAKEVHVIPLELEGVVT